MADYKTSFGTIPTDTPDISAAQRYTMGYDPLLATPEDIKRQRAAAWGTLGAQTGIGAALTAAQIGLAAAPTVTDKTNDRELSRLRKLEKAGKLGLSAGERQQAEATLMNPVRAMATEGRERGEAFLASAGGGNVADLQRERAATKQAVTDAAVKAGIAIEDADLRAEQQQRTELEQRRAYKAERQKVPFEMVGQAIQSIAPTMGKVAAGFAESRAPYDAELLAYANARGKDGQLLHPGLKGLSVADLRAAWSQGTLLSPQTPDTAAKLAAGNMAGGSVSAAP